MSTSFTDRRLLAATSAAMLLALAGCASKPVDTGLDGSGEKHVSKYAAEREVAGDVAESDAVHIPPVPHDPAVEGIAAKAMPEYGRALMAMRNGELEQALVMLQSLHTSYPQLSGPLVNQGRNYWQQEKYDEASDALNKALEVNSQNPYAHNLLGLVMREQGKFDEARQHYLQAVQLDPKYARAHFNLGVLAELYLQDLNLALDHFRAYQGLQKTPDNTVANWIADLERRAPPRPSSTPAAIAAPEAANSDQEVN